MPGIRGGLWFALRDQRMNDLSERTTLAEPDWGKTTRAMSGLVVQPFTDASAEAWDAFIGAHGGTYCHLYGWRRVLERAYGLTCHYLGVYCTGALCAVLPVAEPPRLPWAERQVISLPFCNYGGLVAMSGVEREPVLDAVLEYLSARGVRRLELREVATEAVDTEEVSMRLALPGSEEELWTLVGDKVRNQVRKARKSGLEARWGLDQGAELYDIYAVNMGRLGSPVHARRFVLGILDALGSQADVLTVRLGERAVGAMLVLRFQDTWIDPFASSLPEFKVHNPAMLMYWEALRAACKAGAGAFDLGRSLKGSGTYRFKRQWGAQEVPLHYHSFEHGRPLAAASTMFYRSGSAARLAQVWSLLPALVQNRLGPVVRRWMP